MPNWSFQSDDTWSWCAMDPAFQHELESAFSSGQTKLHLWLCGYKYLIDFEAMAQTNMHT